MKNRVFAFLAALALVAASFFVYLAYIYMLGFPDGYISALHRAERELARVFIGVSAIFAIFCAGVGALSASGKIKNRLIVAVVLYALFLLAVFATDFYYQSTLDNGVGG